MFTEIKLSKSLNLLCLTLFIVTFLAVSISDAPGQNPTTKKKQTKQLTAEEEAGVRLVALSEKGYISLKIGEPSTFMLVEPKVWKALLHKDKVDLCRTALMFLKGYKREKQAKISYLIVWDMTSHDTIARGYLDDNRIEIVR